jgi:lipoprotein-anchoring transpeptidase ErfK/SrfK
MKKMNRRANNFGVIALTFVAALVSVAIVAVAQTGTSASPKRPGPGQYQLHDQYDESPWSDRFTGGHVEHAELVENDPNIEITVDVPAFRLTLWQDGREVTSYRIGVGQKEYPIIIGVREATEVIWNPAWIPPASDWVSGHKGVKPGQIIRASDARNPLGKVKIPLGGGYLIHQAQGARDLGHLVSHGCVRVMLADLYDLAEKINAAYGYPLSAKQIALAKRTKHTVAATLPTPLAVDINYDTLVVEGGALHIYPDVYDHGTNTVARLRAELAASNADASALDDATLEQMLARVKPHNEFVVSLESLAAGRALEDGELRPIVGAAGKQRQRSTVRRAARIE